MNITCDDCGASIATGDIAVTLNLAEELIHGSMLSEPVNLIFTRTWCRPCGWRRATIQRSALNLDSRAVGAQGHANA